METSRWPDNSTIGSHAIIADQPFRIVGERLNVRNRTLRTYIPEILEIDCSRMANTSLCVTCPHGDHGFCSALFDKPGDASPSNQDAGGHYYQTVAAGDQASVRHQVSEYAFVLCGGWAFRFMQLPDGRRQILNFLLGAVAELVGNEVGVVSGVINLESSGVEASDWRLRHDQV